MYTLYTCTSMNTQCFAPHHWSWIPGSSKAKDSLIHMKHVGFIDVKIWKAYGKHMDFC